MIPFRWRWQLLLVGFFLLFFSHPLMVSAQVSDDTALYGDLVSKLLCYINPTYCPGGVRPQTSPPASTLTPVPGGSGNIPTETPVPGKPTSSLSRQPTSLPARQPTPLPQPSVPLSSGNVAVAIKEVIDKFCSGVATKVNGCYYKVKDKDPLTRNGAEVEMDKSINWVGPYFRFQCVGFVKTESRAKGATWDVSHGSARNYAINRPPSGFTFIRKGTGPIQVGDYPIWNNGPDGHIAVVVAVYDQNNFEVVEANLSGKGEMQQNPKYVSRAGDPWATGLIGWLRKL